MKLNSPKLDQTTAGDPGASAPAAPAPAAPAVGESPTAKWDSLIADDPIEAGDPPDEPPAGDAGSTTPPAQPVTPPPAAPTAPAVAAPASPPPPAPVSATPPVATPPATPPADPEAQRKAHEEAQKQVETQLTAMFESSLDEDTKAALLADPAAVIGKLLARAAMTGAQIALHQVPQIVPRMVSSMTNQQRGQAEAWSRFTSVNKDLASPEFAPSLEVAARTLKATGKNYTDDEAIVALGRMVRVMHNLPDPTEAAAPVVAPAAPVAPFTPVARGGVAPAPTAKPTNKWTDLIDN